MVLTVPTLRCYPPAPLNGGALTDAPPKIGAWVWEPKVDDRRVAIHTPTRTIWNQYGKLSVAMAQAEKFKTALDILEEHGRAMAHVPGQPLEWLDAGLMEYRNDMMRGSIIVFDLMGGGALHERRAKLEAVFPILPSACELVGCEAANDTVFLIDQYEGGDATGLTLYRNLQVQNLAVGAKFYEGVVAKRLDSPYPNFQRSKQSTPHWIKHRFDQ
jgi:hypothetical protein